MQPGGESVREILQKLKVKLLCPPVTSQFGTYPKHLTFNPTDTCSAVFIDALFTTARKWKQLRHPPTGEQEVWCIDTVEYYTAAKKKEKVEISGKLVELEITILSEVAQTQ